MRRLLDFRIPTLALLAGLALGARCGSGPAVLGTTPGDGLSAISVHADLTATFDEDVDPGSIRADSLVLTRTGGASVTGSVSLRNRVLGFAPAAPLLGGTSYTARVKSHVTDEDGNPMEADHVWTFVTGASVAAVTPVPVEQDVDTGLTGAAELMMVIRNQRHVEEVSDGTLAMAIQRGQGNVSGPDGVALYRSVNGGLSWSFVDTVATAPATFADLVVRDDDGLLFAYTEATDVTVTGYAYDDLSRSWVREGSALVERFTEVLGPERATVAPEQGGGFWCAFMTPFPDRQLLLYHSADGGTWAPNGQLFGTANTDKKSGKLLPLGDEMWLVYYDLLNDEDRRFLVARRDTADAVSTPWAIEEITRITRPRANDLLDPLNSHWSIARAPNGDVHLVYQDDGIRHVRYDAVSDAWSAEPNILTAGVEAIYPTVAIADDGTVAVTFDFDVERKLSATWSQDGGRSWAFPTIDLHQQSYQGNLRAVSPERFGDRLTSFLQTSEGGSLYRVRGATLQF